MQRRWILGIAAVLVALLAGVLIGRYALPRSDATHQSWEPGAFRGDAHDLVIDPSTINFTRIGNSKRVTAPSGAKKPGWRSGWDVDYKIETPHSFEVASATVYVYGNSVGARGAYDDACPQCGDEQVSSGILQKSWSSVQNGVPIVDAIGLCRNVYIGITAAGTGNDANVFARDEGVVMGATYRKAMDVGMTSCRKIEP